ncbi:hypothetical protein TIFTF001_023034 [Ficus carica]|uniref:Uncharacterized protein n=1 Tax=Ficus carica TaxID=3494 RepID=A0AA88AK70_FICCA|nr:hypothetical protein TIFTF001_023034 [Ficus carica]
MTWFDHSSDRRCGGSATDSSWGIAANQVVVVHDGESCGVSLEAEGTFLEDSNDVVRKVNVGC